MKAFASDSVANVFVLRGLRCLAQPEINFASVCDRSISAEFVRQSGECAANRATLLASWNHHKLQRVVARLQQPQTISSSNLSQRDFVAEDFVSGR